MRMLRGSSAVARNSSQADKRCADRRTEDAQLCLLELLPLECKCGDEQRDSEADPRDRAAAGDSHPADRSRSRPRLSRVSSHEQPRMPTGLPMT